MHVKAQYATLVLPPLTIPGQEPRYGRILQLPWPRTRGAGSELSRNVSLNVSHTHWTRWISDSETGQQTMRFNAVRKLHWLINRDNKEARKKKPRDAICAHDTQ